MDQWDHADLSDPLDYPVYKEFKAQGVSQAIQDHRDPLAQEELPDPLGLSDRTEIQDAMEKLDRVDFQGERDQVDHRECRVCLERKDTGDCQVLVDQEGNRVLLVKRDLKAQ